MKTDASNAEVGLVQSHHKSHMGELWALLDEATGVVIITPKRWLVTLGATARPIHIVVGVVATQPGKFEILEACTVSGNGTALVLMNVKRDFTPTVPVGLTQFRDPTITGEGTLIGVARGGAGVYICPSLSRQEVEWILKPNTLYQLKFTTTVDATTVTLDGTLYEG